MGNDYYTSTTSKSEGYLIKHREYWENKLGPKSKKYAFAPQKTNKIQETNQRSAESLARIQAKYGKPCRSPVVRVVDSKLHVHDL